MKRADQVALARALCAPMRARSSSEFTRAMKGAVSLLRKPGPPRPIAPNLYRAYMNGRLAGRWNYTRGAPYRRWDSPLNIGNVFMRIYQEGLTDAQLHRPPRYMNRDEWPIHPREVFK